VNWNIRYLESVEKWLNALPTSHLKSLAKELRLLELCGNELRLPHSKALGSGLFELRERQFGLRAYYTYIENCAVLILHGGDKSSQEKDIKKAKILLKNYKETSHES